MAAEFTDNLTEFLEDKLKEFNPDIAVGEGTAVRDLFIKPFTVIFQPIVDAITSTRANLSLSTGADLEESDLDLLAANFFVTRKAGSKATGVVRLFFAEPVDEFVSQGTIFVAANGVRFLSTADVTITTVGLRLNTFGDLFFQDINVEAEEAGIDGNIPAELISDTLINSDTITDVTNPAAFTGGADAETNEELVDRLSIAITFRNLINKPGAKLILLENFERLTDVLVVGFGDKYTVEGETPTGAIDGINTSFQVIETEDVVDTSYLITNAVDDETVTTGGGAAAGFQSGASGLDFFPYTNSTLQLAAGASFSGGTPLTAGTDFQAGNSVSIADENKGVAPGGGGPLPATVFFPLDTAPAIQVRFGVDFDTGTPLVLTTDYTVVEATGVVTITAAGEAAAGGADIHVRYNATDPNPETYVLFDSGATIINGASPADLHARYTATPLDTSLATGDFNGVITFTVPPSTGSVITVDYTYFLMQRDRMSGDNLVLGDDTFGTATNVHIGGKVDYYLKFLGLEEKEVRINTLTDENFLFPKGDEDPAATATQQYISTIDRPIVAIKNVEIVDSGTNLPSGTFLTQVFVAPAPTNEYQINILANKTELNLTTRQKIQMDVSTDVVSQDVFFRYFTHQDFGPVQDFIDDEVNRIVTADLLARAPYPIFVSTTVNYSRATGGPDPATVEAEVTNFINNLKLGACLSVYDLANALSDAGVQFVQLPLTLDARRQRVDFLVDLSGTPNATSEIAITTTNKIVAPPNFQFIADTITVNEVALEACDEL